MCDKNPPPTPSSANQNFQIDCPKTVLHTRDDGQQFFDDDFLKCVRRGYHDDVISAIELVDVKKLVDSNGMTLLHHAAAAGSREIVKYLVDRGCEVDALALEGCTPLLFAMANECLPVISILLESNADVFLCPQGILSPLHVAFDMTYQVTKAWTLFAEALKRKYSADCRQIARALLDNNCGVYHAVLLKDVAITRHMLDAGCNVNDRNRDGRTAVHYAVEYMDLDNLKLLLERGGNIYDRDLSKAVWRPLSYYKTDRENSCEMLMTLLNHVASLTANHSPDPELAEKVLQSGQINEIEALLSNYDFDFNVRNYEGKTLLHTLANNKHDGAIHLLEGKQFDVNARDEDGRTALWEAGMSCNSSTLEFLFERGADPNVVDESGETALFRASKKWLYCLLYSTQLYRGGQKCLEVFLEHDADVQHESPGGETIFHIALTADLFAFIRPAIAQVAMIEASGRNVRENILEVLDGNECYKKFFNICRKKIEKLQKTMINDTVTLFQFLIDPEEKLLFHLFLFSLKMDY